MSTNDTVFSLLSLDIAHKRRAFHLYLHSGDECKVRCYLYNNGKPWIPFNTQVKPSPISLTEGESSSTSSSEGDEEIRWTGRFGYGETYQDSTSMHVVESCQSAENDNYVDFWFTATDTTLANGGDLFAQVLLQSSIDEKIIFGDGYLHIIKSPISEATEDLVFARVIDWCNVDEYENTEECGPYRAGNGIFFDGNDDGSVNINANIYEGTVITVDDTDVDITFDNLGVTYIIPSTWTGGNVTFNLPDGDSDYLGFWVRIINRTNYLAILKAGDADNIDNSSTAGTIYSGQSYSNSRNPTSIKVELVEETWYHAIEGRGIWTVT